MTDRYESEWTPWRDEGVLKELYVKRNLSTAEVGAELDCTRKTVELWLDRHEITKPTPWRDEEVLRRLRVEHHLTTHEIASKLGCNQATISNWLNRHGIDADVSTSDKPWQDEERLRSLYHDRELEMGQIADELDCSRQTIEKWIHEFGMETRSRNPPAPDELRDPEHLEFLYVGKGLSTYRIAERLGCAPTTVHRWLEKHDIDKRQVGSQTGHRHHRWKGGQEPYYGPTWRRQRRRARERDGYRCQQCGVTEQEHQHEHNEELHVHHIVPLREFDDTEEANELDNLVTVCCACHNRIECGEVEVTKR